MAFVSDALLLLEEGKKTFLPPCWSLRLVKKMDHFLQI